MVTSELEYIYSDAKTKLLIECQDFFPQNVFTVISKVLTTKLLTNKK